MVLELLCLIVRSVISDIKFINSSTITLTLSPLIFFVAFSQAKEPLLEF